LITFVNQIQRGIGYDSPAFRYNLLPLNPLKGTLVKGFSLQYGFKKQKTLLLFMVGHITTANRTTENFYKRLPIAIGRSDILFGCDPELDEGNQKRFKGKPDYHLTNLLHLFC